MKKLFLPFLLIIIISFTGCSFFKKPPVKETEPDHDHTHGTPATIGEGNLSIHFLELGNKYTGDSVFIDFGDLEILVDAGSRTDSAAAIIAQIDPLIGDGTIEFVIATHNHQDHVAAFPKIFEKYQIGTIIDYARTGSTSNAGYRTARDAAKGKGTTVVTALDCWKDINGGHSIYDLGQDNDGNAVSLEILYNKFYETNTSTENNYSTVFLIRQGTHQYFFSGDMEKTGEDALVDYYATRGGIGKCTLYKGGHHGSSTSSNDKLLAEIQPEYVCICSCADSDEYNTTGTQLRYNCFPTQATINRLAPYTDKIYITTLVLDYKNNIFESLNGTIVFALIENEPTINCSNHNLKLKNQPWFTSLVAAGIRTMPASWI